MNRRKSAILWVASGLLFGLTGCQVEVLTGPSTTEEPIEEESYPITLAENLDDAATLSFPESATAGEEVRIETQVEEGRWISSLTANDVELSPDDEGTYAFIMPESPVRIAYTVDVETFTCRFFNDDGTLLETQEVPYGEDASYTKEEPSHPASTYATYTFTGWNRSLENIREDTDFFAVYDVVSSADFVFSIQEGENGEQVAYLSNYLGKNKAVVNIPSTFDGLPVVGIGTNAFLTCENISTVNVPESITTLANYAFADSPVERILGMEGVKTIGTWAFSSCPNLIEVSLPETLESLGASAFRESGIEEVVLPDNIPEVNYLFYHAPNVKTVHLPTSWTAIPDSTFNGATSLEEFNWPENITRVGNNAFMGVCGIASLEVPDGVTTAGYYAFAQMEKLSSIALPQSLETIGQWLFYQDIALTEVVLSDNITTTKWGIFTGCTALRSVHLPDNLEELGYEAFMNCPSLTSIELPDSLTEVGHTAFANCTSLEEVVWPESVAEIADYTFYGCTSLDFEVPATVTQVGAAAFKGIQNIDIADGSAVLKKENGYLLSGDGTVFYGLLEEKKAIVLPDGVTTIASYALTGETIDSLAFPSSLTTLEEGALTGILGLENLVVPESVQAMDEAFKGTDYDDNPVESSLRKVTIRADVDILDTTFEDNTAIEEVLVLSSSVTGLDTTFRGATSLKSLYLPRSLKTININTYSNVPNTIEISYEGSEEEFYLILDDSGFRNFHLTANVPMESIE